MPTAAEFGARFARRAIRSATISTMHRALAFDALESLDARHGDGWRRMFFAHADLFAFGADAPDTDFRDFKNHVLMPRDGFWGGAPAKAQSWYQNLVAALGKQEWRNVAYCAGVLSHYVTDPLHPFHTGQTEAENDIHLAVDTSTWSVYPDLLRQATQQATPFVLPPGPNFIVEAMSAAATQSNADYERLLAHFDFGRAVADPTSGLDAIGRGIMAASIRRATTLFAALLDRAIAEAKASPPPVSLIAPGLKAWLSRPLAGLDRFKRGRAAQHQLALAFDELMRTGGVSDNLSEEERAKRDLYAKEVAAQRPRASVDNVFPFPQRRVDAGRPQPAPQDGHATADVVSLRRPRVVGEPPRPAPPHVEPQPIRRRADVVAQIAAEEQSDQADGNHQQAVPVKRAATAETVAASAETAAVGHAAAAALTPAGATMASFRDRRSVPPPQTSLSGDSGIDAAPSITADMAQKLRAAGIDTIDQLLSAQPPALADRIGSTDLTADSLTTVQDEARLLLALTGLSGSDARILVGAGYRSAASIAEAEPEKFCADILAYAATAAGAQLLRDGAPPDVARIRAWSEAARLSRAA